MKRPPHTPCDDEPNAKRSHKVIEMEVAKYQFPSPMPNAACMSKTGDHSRPKKLHKMWYFGMQQEDVVLCNLKSYPYQILVTGIFIFGDPPMTSNNMTLPKVEIAIPWCDMSMSKIFHPLIFLGPETIGDLLRNLKRSKIPWASDCDESAIAHITDNEDFAREFMNIIMDHCYEKKHKEAFVEFMTRDHIPDAYAQGCFGILGVLLPLCAKAHLYANQEAEKERERVQNVMLMDWGWYSSSVNRAFDCEKWSHDPEYLLRIYQ